jgi:hypothetical protein
LFSFHHLGKKLHSVPILFCFWPLILPYYNGKVKLPMWYCSLEIFWFEIFYVFEGSELINRHSSAKIYKKEISHYRFCRPLRKTKNQIMIIVFQNSTGSIYLTETFFILFFDNLWKFLYIKLKIFDWSNCLKNRNKIYFDLNSNESVQCERHWANITEFQMG